MQVETVIIAQNSATVVGAAVRSARVLGPVLVVDGGSEDETIAVAEAEGARVLKHRFLDYAEQYNWGIERAGGRWVLILDSDERVSSSLAAEIVKLRESPGVVAYWVPRQNYFLGKLISHSGWSPDLNIRLLRKGHALYDPRPVHSRVEILGGVAHRLEGHIEHLAYTSVEQYVDKLNAYTTLEARARRSSESVVDGRSQLRRIFRRLPFHSALRFVYMYVVRLGLLDGRAGYDLAVLSAMYEFVADLKSRVDTDSSKRSR